MGAQMKKKKKVAMARLQSYFFQGKSIVATSPIRHLPILIKKLSNKSYIDKTYVHLPSATRR
jgi:hypothetical protein